MKKITISAKKQVIIDKPVKSPAADYNKLQNFVF